MKRIAYIVPIDYMRGNLSGAQNIEYNDGRAYDIPNGTTQPADSYQPRLVAQLRNNGVYDLRCFQVRTKTSVHMTQDMRLSMAVLGGAGAMFAQIINTPTAAISVALHAEYEQHGLKGDTFRSFVMAILMAGLKAKNATITFPGNTEVVNPWVSAETPNVPVSQTILDKFASVLSNS